jgi:predicted secreted protein
LLQAKSQQVDSEQLARTRAELTAELEALNSESRLLAAQQSSLLGELNSLDTSIATSSNNLQMLEQRNALLSQAAQSLLGLPSLPSLQEYREDGHLANLRETARIAVKGARAAVLLQETRIALLVARDKGKEVEWKMKEAIRQQTASSGLAKDENLMDEWDSLSIASGSVNSWKPCVIKSGTQFIKGKFAIPSDKLSIHTGAETRACTAEDRDDEESVLSRELFHLGLGQNHASTLLGKRTPLAEDILAPKNLNSKPFVELTRSNS